VLPADEQEGVDGCLRQIDFLTVEIERIDRTIAEQALASEKMRRLLTLPGVSATTAAALWAAIGDVSRFPSARHLVSYLGLNPKVAQSGLGPARHGRISKQGPGIVRHVLVEAAWHAARTTGPLRAFSERIRSRRGVHVATVAVARKLATIAWQMLTKGEDYAFARPSLVREKIRHLELMVGAERHQGKRTERERVFATPERRRLEKELALQAEVAYRRLVADWRPEPSKKKGAGATPERASHGPSSGQTARQGSAPEPAL
jgi:transposase